MAVIQLFARERYERSGSARRTARITGPSSPRRATISFSTHRSRRWARSPFAVLLWYGGGEIIAGAVSFGVLVAFIQYNEPVLPADS